MTDSNPTVAFLRDRCHHAGAVLYQVLPFCIAWIAITTAIMMFRGFLDATVTSATYALCSVLAIGLGLLYGKQANVLIWLGTIIAGFAASYAFYQVVAAHPDQWVLLGFSFGFPLMSLWALVASYGNDISAFANKNPHWANSLLMLAHILLVFGIPMGCLLGLVWLSR